MGISLYQPFKTFHFGDNICFLSGQDAQTRLDVFPAWIRKEFGLDDKPLKMLDDSVVSYKQLSLPATNATVQASTELEAKIQQAFSEGYDAVKELDPLFVVQWAGKLLYGVLFHEIRTGLKHQQATGETFNFSQSLIHKFGNFHTLLQSLVVPIEFEEPKPYSVLVFKVDNEPGTFLYRDEINTLTFSLRMNEFGIIVCFQDNGTNRMYHSELMEQLDPDKALQPIQFEEICARFFYSAYLFNRLPEYTTISANGTFYIEAMPLRGISSKPLFDEWNNKTYGQVLENFWKPWGHVLFEIIKDPEKPMTFL